MGDYGGQGGGWGGGGGGGGGWGGGGGYNQGGGYGGGGGNNSYGGSWGGGGGRGGGNVRPGDWQCPSGCGNVFASKMNCFRCGQPKPEGLGDDQGSYGGGFGGGGGYQDRGGYGGRGGGFGGERRGPTPRPGDWNCPQGCGLVFASKHACFRCGTPKPEGAGSEYGERQPEGYGGGGGGFSGGSGGGFGGGGGRGPGDITNDEYRSSGRAAQDLADSLDRQPRGGPDDIPPQ